MTFYLKIIIAYLYILALIKLFNENIKLHFYFRIRSLTITYKFLIGRERRESWYNLCNVVSIVSHDSLNFYKYFLYLYITIWCCSLSWQIYKKTYQAYLWFGWFYSNLSEINSSYFAEKIKACLSLDLRRSSSVLNDELSASIDLWAQIW